MVCCTSDRFPPIKRPVAFPGSTGRERPLPSFVPGRGTVTARPADERVHPRIEPHHHQTLGTTVVFASREAAHLLDLRVENDGEPCALERLYTAHQPALFWRIRRSDDTDRAAFRKSFRSK